MISFRENTTSWYRLESALPLKIIHRLSIDNPSIVHRFDGVTMEQRWSSDGDASEVERRISGIYFGLLWHVFAFDGLCVL